MKKFFKFIFILAIIFFIGDRTRIIDLPISKNERTVFINETIPNFFEEKDKDIAGFLNEKLPGRNYKPSEIKKTRMKIIYGAPFFIFAIRSSIKNRRIRYIREFMALNYKEISDVALNMDKCTVIPFEGNLPAIFYVSLLGVNNPIKYKHGYIYTKILMWCADKYIEIYETEDSDLVLKVNKIPDFENKADMDLFELFFDLVDEDGCVFEADLKSDLWYDFDNLCQYYDILMEVGRQYLIKNDYLNELSAYGEKSYKLTSSGINEAAKLTKLDDYIFYFKKQSKDEVVSNQQMDRLMELSYLLNKSYSYLSDVLKINPSYKYKGLPKEDMDIMESFVENVFKKTMKEV